MRKYRYYNNIKWGARYNSKTQAHHIEAKDYDDLRKNIPSSTDGHSIQVETCQGWQWASSVPIHLGGFARHWHGEKI